MAKKKSAKTGTQVIGMPFWLAELKEMAEDLESMDKPEIIKTLDRKIKEFERAVQTMSQFADFFKNHAPEYDDGEDMDGDGCNRKKLYGPGCNYLSTQRRQARFARIAISRRSKRMPMALNDAALQ